MEIDDREVIESDSDEDFEPAKSQKKARGGPNPHWATYAELPYSRQCNHIVNYLESVRDGGGKVYPSWFDKGAKSTFRKSIKAYLLNNEGKLWHRSTIAGIGRCHAMQRMSMSLIWMLKIQSEIRPADIIISTFVMPQSL